MGTSKYSYASGGQLWTEDGPFADDTVTNTYNNRLRVKLDLQQPTGVWTNAFGYDAAKRLTSVTSPAGAFGYTFVGQASRLIQKLSLPNTSYITNTYDSVARLTSTTLKNSSHSTLNSHQYAYNPGNQRTQQVFNAGSTYDYIYDAIGQLKAADSGTASEDRGYTYDTAWNLNFRTNNSTLQTFSVDGLNQLTSAPDGACTYDANGNLTSCGGMALEFGYDDENRFSVIQSNLVAYTNYPFRQTLFSYDGQGRLRLRLELQNTHVPDPGGGDDSLVEGGGGGMTWSTNSVTRYIYDGWRVIQERDETNEPQVNYTRGTDLSGSLEGAGGIGGLLARSYGYNSGNMLFHVFYHGDGNGNITYLANTSQTLAASYRYDPYGNVISSSGGLANVNTYRFSSKEVHLRTGFYYYGYRFYEPSFQRWPNRDPINEPGFNLLRGKSGTFDLDEEKAIYCFVRNDPISRSDVLGLGLCAPLLWRLGCIEFVGCSTAQLNDFRVIPESKTGTLTTPSNGWNCSADGFWVRGNTNWLKVPDHCYARVTCSGGGFSIDCCCNACVGGVRWVFGKPGCGFHPDAGSTTIHTDYPF